jgi:hypothetical protein
MLAHITNKPHGGYHEAERDRGYLGWLCLRYPGHGTGKE